MKRRRIIVNNDFFNIFQPNPPISDQDVYDAVDRITAPNVPGSQVDALFLMVDHGLDGRLPANLVKLYDHPDADPCINELTAFKAAGKDPWAMVLKRARARKIDLFGSVRMNDTHYKDQPYHPWMEQFYYDHLHERVRQDTQINGRADTEYDYRKTAVQEHSFEIIRGCVEKYDVDGIEMDFTRNCRYFPDPNREECAPVMTDFVRRVRELLDAVGKKRKRRMELAATTPYSLYRTRLEGLDIPTWARLGYIDMVCMSSPWQVDGDRDMADTALKVPGVPVYGGCDRNLVWPGRPFPKEGYRAMAMNYLRHGAAGIYLYNVMHWTTRLEVPQMTKDFGGGSLVVNDDCLMREVGEIQTLDRLDKLYIVPASGPSPDKPNGTLPVNVPALGEVHVQIRIGDDIAAAAKDGAIEHLWVQVISSDCDEYNNYTIKLNGIDLARQYAFMPFANKPKDRFIFLEPENTMPACPVERVRRHPARAIDLHLGLNFVTIKSWKKAMTVSEVEIGVVYRKK